jgi:methyl-accepting chemotaxis protein
LSCSFIALTVARSISHPLVRLTHAADRMKQGDLLHRIDLDQHNEIGALAESFNAMAARLHAVITNLDSLVEARTISTATCPSSVGNTGSLQKLKVTSVWRSKKSW